MLGTVPVLSTLSMFAYAALCCGGALLWRQARSLATTLIVVGFAILLIDQVALLFSYLRIIDSVQNGDSLFLVYHRAHSAYFALAGLCVAAIGFVWHAGTYSPGQR